MSFQPSAYSGTVVPMKHERPIPPSSAALRAAADRTRGRIAATRAAIRSLKPDIRAAARAKKDTLPLRSRLHSLEWVLHRDHHLLNVLHRPLSPAAHAAALAYERQAANGVMSPRVAGFPAAPTAPPAKKSEAEVVKEATVEATDANAADAHDAEAAGLAPSQGGDLVPMEDVPFYKRPLVWIVGGLGLGAVVLSRVGKARASQGA